MFTRLICFSVLFSIKLSISQAQESDKPFLQAVSVKFAPGPELKGAELKKVLVDYNNIAYVLSDQGVLRVSGESLVKDLRYTPLAAKVPVDIAIQESAGHLYYLYADKVLTNGYAGVPYKNLPAGKYSLLAVDRTGRILLAGSSEVSLLDDGNITDINGVEGNVIKLYTAGGQFYVLSEKGVYQLKGDRMVLIHPGAGISDIDFRSEEMIIGTSNGYYGINLATGDTSISLQTRVPVPSINCVRIVSGRIWAGTQEGAFMQEPSGSYRYYASRRWLNEDHVKGMDADGKGNLFLLSPTGLNKIEFRNETLASKARYFQDLIRERHIRYGFISEVTMEVPGDLGTAKMTDTDNDGLWSAFYLGSQSFRYAVTKAKDAKRYAWEAFEAFERLLSVNPLKGFPARTFERTGFKHSDPDRWHPSQDPEWEWKGTTSSDEFVGYIFIAAVLNDLVAETNEEKKHVADFMDKILTHIIDNNYYFIDADGKPTLWGRWNPEYINSFPETVGDRRLGSETIIAGLQLGFALTGKERYRSEAFRLMNEHGYLKNMQLPYAKMKVTPTVHMGVTLGDGWNHSDDEMAFLTYWVLHRYAFNKELKKTYAALIKEHWEIEKPERNSLWNLISLGTSGAWDRESTLWHLREYPLDLIRWTIRNSHRKDIEKLPPNFRDQYTRELLPPGEQPMHRHNANAFNLDGGGGGRSELAGDEFLLPYWMARYLKVID